VLIRCRYRTNPRYVSKLESQRCDADSRILNFLVHFSSSPPVSSLHRLWDNPMILVSDGFAKLTGYATDEIVGLNCRVFQGELLSYSLGPVRADDSHQYSGPCTAQASYSVICEAVYGEKPITKLVLNCSFSLISSSTFSLTRLDTTDRRNGEPFYNLIQIIPIKNLIGEVQFFLGGVSDVTDLLHPFSTKAPSRGTAENAVRFSFPCRIVSRLTVYTSRLPIVSTPEFCLLVQLLARSFTLLPKSALSSVSLLVSLLPSRAHLARLPRFLLLDFPPRTRSSQSPLPSFHCLAVPRRRYSLRIDSKGNDQCSTSDCCSD